MKTNQAGWKVEGEGQVTLTIQKPVWAENDPNLKITELFEIPAGYALVPIAPTEEQWSGLARHIMMWLDMSSGQPTVKKLFDHLDMLCIERPSWFNEESELRGMGVPSKGTRVAIIYRAMIEDYLKSQQNNVD